MKRADLKEIARLARLAADVEAGAVFAARAALEEQVAICAQLDARQAASLPSLHDATFALGLSAKWSQAAAAAAHRARGEMQDSALRLKETERGARKAFGRREVAELLARRATEAERKREVEAFERLVATLLLAR